MEASSPLAAMQPSSAFLGHYGFRADMPPSFPSYAALKSFGPNSFNFKDVSMKKSQSDYFSMKPMRGSSPTASLAADLSQNFHIDHQSPQLPTPRRALFVSGFPRSAPGRGNLTTPPIPSSPPGPSSDSMEISPLPHKAPFGATFETQLQSPTPELTPADTSILSIPSPPLDSPMQDLRLSLPQERKKPGPLRPTLCRTKGFSTNSIPHRTTLETCAPAFKFGSGASKLSTSSSMTLSEMFVESPLQEKPMYQASPCMGPPRSRQPLSGLTSNIKNGSPVNAHIRKSSNPLIRPRKQFRRSLSMFEHPEDIINEGNSIINAPTLPSIMDVEIPHTPQLPHFSSDDQSGNLPRITKETLIQVLDGNYNHLYEKLVIVDCRFEYEYNGGHVTGAVNFNDKDRLASQLFDVEPTSKALLIFHCEYSAHRAPIMAKFIRNKDRNLNAERYPTLTYPESYILDGGYSSFFKAYRSRCFPQNYVEMDAKEHVQACERGLGKVKQRSKLMRAQTFAFGQHSSTMDSSPTAQGRASCAASMTIDMDLNFDTRIEFNCSPKFETSRMHSRRMFSY